MSESLEDIYIYMEGLKLGNNPKINLKKKTKEKMAWLANDATNGA